MVLVSFSRTSLLLGYSLQTDNYLQSLHQGLCDKIEIQVGGREIFSFTSQNASNLKLESVGGRREDVIFPDDARHENYLSGESRKSALIQS